MPFDSNGKFTRLYCWEDDRKNDIDIVADRHDEEDDNFAEALSNCMTRNGNGAMSGDLKMGGFQIKNLADASSVSDAVTKRQLNNLSAEINTLLEQKVSYMVVNELPENPVENIFYFVKETVE